jgi:hypothetical protein
MNYKYNLKYFKSSDWPVPVGSAMVIIGLIPVVLEIVGAGGFRFIPLGVIAAVIGACFMAFSLGGKSNEADFDDQINRITGTLQQTALKKLGLEDKHVKVIPLYDPYRFGEYDFTGSENLLVKRGKDGKYRCSVYSQSLLCFTADKLCFCRQRFSFLSEYNDYFNDVIPYTEIDSVFITEGSYKALIKKNTVTIKYVMFNIKNTDGRIFTAPAHNDADLDKLVEKIMKLAGQKKAVQKA